MQSLTPAVDMKRREFIALLAGATAWPVVARAQQAAMPVVGFLSSFTTNPRFAAAFRRGLAEAGYVEGQNVTIEYQWAKGGQYDQLSTLAADLVRRRVALIVASPIPAALAAKAATTTIPIVFAIGSDPVESGLVTSLNRPNENITGVSFLSVGLGAKRLELLRSLVPKAGSIALLVNPNNSNAEPQTKETQAAAAGLGLHLEVLKASSRADFDSAFSAIDQQRVGAMVVSADPFFISERVQLIALAARHAVPAIYYAREFVEAGGLMSYGSDFAIAYAQAGTYAGRLLKGEKVTDLPVMLSPKFELVLNLKAVKGLGIDVPANLLALADDVIE
jgi:putative ABC transport system substrate-binding protein